jgi:hypothetical protein
VYVRNATPQNVTIANRQYSEITIQKGLGLSSEVVYFSFMAQYPAPGIPIRW